MSNNIIDKIQLSGVTYDIGGQGGSGVSVVEVTQAEYDALPSSAKTDTSKMYVITDAEAGDLTNYYTKTETNTLLGGKADTATTYTKTEVDNAITAATSTKQDTLVSSVNIKTINNTSILGSGNIDIQGGGGGGKAVSGGTNISITTGETADTINCTLYISNGSNYGDIQEGNSSASGGWSHAEGSGTKATANYSHAEGYQTSATTVASHAEGNMTAANGNCSHTEGSYTIAKNQTEHASGRYNVSSSASTTFGDSGNTLFSVGNGTADNARHNAFEIRQNGDIYLSSGGTDIKLQDHLGGGGGGGKAIEAGRGISVTTGETADTVSFNLPISAGTGTGALIIASDTYNLNNKASGDYAVSLNGGAIHPNYATGNRSLAEGSDTRAVGESCHAEGHATSAGTNTFPFTSNAHAEGDTTYAKGSSSHAEGSYTSAMTYYSHTEGYYTIANNSAEHASGKYNVSNTGSTDADKTLFSVGNGTNTSNRHNAFEIRQNGDIYCSDGTNDVKLQDTITATASNTTALGGLKLVKLTQSEYDALATKDSNTLYVIVN